MNYMIKGEKCMKIGNRTGGLGNQMFQYAFAMALQHRHPRAEISGCSQACFRLHATAIGG